MAIHPGIPAATDKEFSARLLDPSKPGQAAINAGLITPGLGVRVSRTKQRKQRESSRGGVGRHHLAPRARSFGAVGTGIERPVSGRPLVAGQPVEPLFNSLLRLDRSPFPTQKCGFHGRVSAGEGSNLRIAAQPDHHLGDAGHVVIGSHDGQFHRRLRQLGSKVGGEVGNVDLVGVEHRNVGRERGRFVLELGEGIAGAVERFEGRQVVGELVVEVGEELGTTLQSIVRGGDQEG